MYIDIPTMKNSNLCDAKLIFNSNIYIKIINNVFEQFWR